MCACVSVCNTSNLIEHHVVVIPAGVGHDRSLLGIKHWNPSTGEGLELKRGDIGGSLPRSEPVLGSHATVLLLLLLLLLLLDDLGLGAGQL